MVDLDTTSINDGIAAEAIQAAARVLEDSSFTELSPTIAELLAEEVLVAALGKLACGPSGKRNNPRND